MGIEPTTYSLGSCRSTTELRPHRGFGRQDAQRRRCGTFDPQLHILARHLKRVHSAPLCAPRRGSETPMRGLGFTEERVRSIACARGGNPETRETDDWRDARA
jgi:hypothetical protein